MGRVTADGEEVVFDEGTPTSPRDIFDLVSQALGDQRRAIVKFDSDKEDCLTVDRSQTALSLLIFKVCTMMRSYYEFLSSY